MHFDTIGICSTGIYEPSRIEYVEQVKDIEGLTEERIKKNGVTCLRIASDNESPSVMAIEAAKSAIERAGIVGKEIDLVVYTQAFLPDHLIWPDYAEIQHAIGAINANSMKILQQCNGQLACLDYVYAKMQVDQSINIVLIVAAEKYAKPLIDRWNSNALFWGDGASAVLVRRAEETNRILGTKLATDGAFNRLWQASYKGGAVCPISHENRLEKDEMLVDYLRSGGEYQFHSPLRETISNTMLAKNMQVISDLIEQLNGRVRINKIATVNRELSWIEKLAQLFDLGIEDTSAYLVKNYGHMGACDILFNLHKMLVDGVIERGDGVLLFGAGAGYSVGGVLLEYY